MIRISEARNSRKMKQVELAKKMNISRTNLSRYETGEREPDINTLLSIANILQTSLDYLCGNSESLEFSKDKFLSDFELNHIKKYRCLNNANRQILGVTIDTMLETQEKENKKGEVV